MKLSIKDDLNVLEEKIIQMKEDGEKITNETLWNEGAKLISARAKGLIHPSGRRWKGKSIASSGTNPFTSINSNLAVTVLTKSKYHYLYFPDDGSNTRRHIGNQQFMLRGAQEASGQIIEVCLARLTKK